MMHHMGLDGEYFGSIREGRKTVEVRLNDEKRRKLRVGDAVEFSSVTGPDETIRVEVLGLRPYQTFAEMYEAIPFPDFGCAGWTMEQKLEGTYKIAGKALGHGGMTIKWLESRGTSCHRQEGAGGQW